MILIPYTPTPYPDETIGSVLTRFAIHNGDSVCRKIANDVGIENPNLSMYQTASADLRVVDFIAERMGYSHSEAIQSLTTIPFMRAFHKASVHSLNLDLIENTQHANHYRSIGFPLARGQLGARYCAACLAEDVKEVGEPYLHRHHQIPAAIVCATHGEWLRTTCPSCNLLVLPVDRMILRPLSLRCECGADLRSPSEDGDLKGSAFQRLSEFCRDALSSRRNDWTRAQVLNVACSVLKRHTRDISNGYRELLESTYGTAEKLSVHKIKFTPHEKTPSLHLYATVENFQANEFAALFSAAGLTFNDLENRIEKLDFYPSLSFIKSTKYTVADAQQALKRFSQANPVEVATKFQRHHPQLYWLLRISDPSSIQEFCPKLHQIPSIASDRENLQRLFEKEKNAKTILSKQSRPLFRAIIRDGIWLQDALDHSPSDRKSPPRIKIDNIDKNKNNIAKHEEQAWQLSRALMTALRLERRPEKITRARLARLASMPLSTVNRVIHPHSTLHKLISQINADKDRRMALWAAQAIAISGEVLTPATVLLVGGLNTTAYNRNNACLAITLVATGFCRQAISSTIESDPRQRARLQFQREA